jgi:hypothetical protein
MVEVAEATWVLYLLSSLLRVASSIIQLLPAGIMAGEGCEGGGEKGACSVCLSRVIPEGFPFGAEMGEI